MSWKEEKPQGERLLPKDLLLHARTLSNYEIEIQIKKIAAARQLTLTQGQIEAAAAAINQGDWRWATFSSYS